MDKTKTEAETKFDKYVAAVKTVAKNGVAPTLGEMKASSYRHGIYDAGISHLDVCRAAGLTLSKLQQRNLSRPSQRKKSRPVLSALEILEQLDREKQIKQRERAQKRRKAIEAACAGCPCRVFLNMDDAGYGYCARTCPERHCG